MHPLKIARLKEGLTRDELSELSGIASKTIAHIENGTSPYKTHVGVAAALADALYLEKVSDIFSQFELSHRGRPPHTGKPIGVRETVIRHVCPGCFLEVPTGTRKCIEHPDAEILVIGA